MTKLRIASVSAETAKVGESPKNTPAMAKKALVSTAPPQYGRLALVSRRNEQPRQKHKRHDDTNEVPGVKGGGRAGPFGDAIAQEAEHETVDGDFREEAPSPRKRRFIPSFSESVISLFEPQIARLDPVGAELASQAYERQRSEHERQCREESAR